MKDSTWITLGGYGMATAITLMLLYTDGPTAAAAAVIIAGAGAGVGNIVAKRIA